MQAADGTRRQADTVIFGTGFHVTDMPMVTWIRGRDGRTLAEVWSGGAQAHRGTTVAGFPNLFILVGPNTRLGHTSLILSKIEANNPWRGSLMEIEKSAEKGAEIAADFGE